MTAQSRKNLAQTVTRIPCYTDPVANLTITVDDATLRRARVKAAEQGTSVNAVLREELERFAGDSSHRSIAEDFLAVANEIAGSSGPEGHNWKREDLYEERMKKLL